MLKTFAEWRSAGGGGTKADIANFLALQTVDTSAVTSEQAIALKLKMEYPAATQEWIKARLEKDYLINISPDKLKEMVEAGKIDENDIHLRRGNIEIDGAKAKAFIQSAQAQNLEPRTKPVASDPAAMDQLHRQLQGNLSQDVQAIKATPQTVKLSETENFDFAIPDASLKGATDLVLFEQDGKLVVNSEVMPRAELLKAIALYNSRDVLTTSITTKVSGAVEQRVRDEVSGRAPIPGGGGAGGPAPVQSAREQAILAGVQKHWGGN